MDALSGIVQQILDLISAHIFAGVFAAALTETILPVIPSLVIFPLAGYLASEADMNLPSVILLGVVGGAGATAGSVVPFVIAWKLGRLALKRYLRFARISDDKLVRAEGWFERHGNKAVFFGRLVPAVRELISIPAGLLHMNLYRFLIYTFLGSCIWCLVLVVSGYYLGPEVFNRLLQ